MRKLIYTLVCGAALMLGACDTMATSEETGYDMEKANALAEKVANGDEMSQADYSEMITQCQGAAKEIEARFDKVLEIKGKGDVEEFQKSLESLSDDNIMSAFENFNKFGEHLATADLDSVNARRWEELKPRAQSIFAKSIGIFQ